MCSLSVRRAGKFGPTLTANAFGHHPCDEITEIQVLEGAANVRRLTPNSALPPAFARATDHRTSKSNHGAAAGMLTEQIAYRNAVGRDGVMPPKFRD
jgi:hypothetical protein